MHMLPLFSYFMSKTIANFARFKLSQQRNLVSVNLVCDATSLADWWPTFRNKMVSPSRVEMFKESGHYEYYCLRLTKIKICACIVSKTLWYEI
jgi:hypothetical protein